MDIRRQTLAVLALTGALAAVASPSFAETIQVGPADDLATALTGLSPGDEVVLGDGTHDLGNGIDTTLDGNEDAPIVIRAEDGARPVLAAESADTVLSFAGNHFTLSGFEVTATATALALDAENVVVRDLLISEGTVGVDCARCLEVTLADIEVTSLDGEAAFLLGETDDSTIDHNWIHDLAGTTDGIRFASPGGGNVVRDNVVSSVGGVGIAVTDDPTAAAFNAVQANWVTDSGGHGIRLVGRARIVNNVVLRAGSAGIFGRLGAEGAAEIAVLHNTVIDATEPCFRAEDWALSSGDVVLANNALYCDGGDAIRFDDGGGFATIAGNVYLGAADRPGDSSLGDGLDDFESPGDDNYFPATESSLIDAGDPLFTVSVDFNDGLREMSAPDAGAYERTAETNPIPNPGGGFKPDTGELPGDALPPGDAGPTDDAGPMGDAGPDAGGTGSSGRATVGSTTGFDERDDGCCSTTSRAPLPLTIVLLLFGIAALRRRLPGAAQNDEPGS